MNILIIGAGAVGKVYGRHLSMGGAAVTFLVKEKYAESARKGFYLYPLNDSRYRKSPLFWKNFSVITRPEEAQKTSWDYVILSMSSPALRSGWLENFLVHVPGVTFVTLQPGLLDKDYLLKRIPSAKLIDGTIHLISFDASLTGTAYWFPPGMFAAFSGEETAVKNLLAVFRKGSFSVKKVPDARKLNIVAAPVLVLFVFGLKHSDWSLHKFSQNAWLRKTVQAIPQAVAVQAKHAGVSTPPTFFITAFFLNAFVKVAQKIMPFDFEAHLKLHFSKVDDQMTEMLDDLISLGIKNGLPVDQIQKLKSETNTH